MSRTRPSPGQQWTLGVGCPECGSPSGVWCRTGTWEYTQKLHSLRWADNGQHQAAHARRVMNDPEGLMMI